MKCWNSAFNAQGSRVIIATEQAGAVKKYVAAVEALGKKKRQDETQFTTKILWKSWFGSQLFHFVKFSFPVTHLMPYYAETGPSCPPNRVNLGTTLMCCLTEWFTCCCGEHGNKKYGYMGSLNLQRFNWPALGGHASSESLMFCIRSQKEWRNVFLVYAHVLANSNRLHANTSWLWEYLGRIPYTPTTGVLCILFLNYWNSEKLNLKTA
jgi:hypothetical protein